jgi:hypothetical protein
MGGILVGGVDGLDAAIDVTIHNQIGGIPIGEVAFLTVGEN